MKINISTIYIILTYFTIISSIFIPLNTYAQEDPLSVSNKIGSLSREEKNEMITCPLHHKHMSISDNFRAGASDFTESDHYPFAYQLNYRRYCSKCTKIMQKEAHIFDIEPGMVAEKCILHNKLLKLNPDWQKYENDNKPAYSTPHAKQYLHQYYCPICTKVHKIENK